MAHQTTDKEGMATAPRRRRVGAMRLLITSIIFLVLALIWSLFMRGTLRATQVDSSSMEPTIEVHDRLIVEVITPRDTIAVGEIVTFRSPDDDGPDLVKRVVAVPGDTVEFREGYFYRNGNPSPAPGLPPIAHGSKNYLLKLAPNQYYVLGDNRANSHDSEDFGPIARSMINGRVFYRYSPRTRMGTVQ